MSVEIRDISTVALRYPRKAPKPMSVATCATPATASKVQVLRDVFLCFFDAIANATIRKGNARKIRGAKNTPRTFGYTSVDAQSAAPPEADGYLPGSTPKAPEYKLATLVLTRAYDESSLAASLVFPS